MANLLMYQNVYFLSDECSAPVVMYAKSLKKDVYAHKEHVYKIVSIISNFYYSAANCYSRPKPTEMRNYWL
jgi:hypothetical protein